MRVQLQAAEAELGEVKPMVQLLQKELSDGKSSFQRMQGSTNDTVNGLLQVGIPDLPIYLYELVNYTYLNCCILVQHRLRHTYQCSEGYSFVIATTTQIPPNHQSPINNQ
jgi:hypothetical protein